MKSFITTRRYRRTSTARRHSPIVERLDDRTLPSGFAPDPSFGEGGFVATRNDKAGTHTIALAPDGKIVELVMVGDQSSVRRFNPDGSPDISFGNQGVAPSSIDAEAVAVQPDGSIVVGGEGHLESRETTLSVIRLLPGGALDTSFGNGGQVDLRRDNFTTYTVIDLAIDGEGRIVVIGNIYSGSDRLLLAGRIDSEGQLDTSFGNGGFRFQIDFPLKDPHDWEDLEIQPDGKILIAGHFAVVRYDANGQNDPTFGTAYGFGVVGPGLTPTASAVALQPDGKILVLVPSLSFGDDSFGLTGALARMNSDGTPDYSFGTYGVARWLSPLIPTGLAVEPDGHIDVAGYTPGDSPQGMIVRFLPDGNPDPTHHDLLTAQKTGALIAAPGGGLIVGGSVTPAGSQDRYAVVVKEIAGPEADADVQYVSQLYAALLGRLPDTPGLDGFVSELRAGAPRGLVARQIMGSDEYLTRRIASLYRIILGRLPDAPGQANWLALLHSGGTLIEVEAGLRGSREAYQGLGGLYQTILGREPDPFGEAVFTQELTNGVPITDVSRALIRSRESATNRVQAYYHAFLHRDADPAGLASWTDVCLATGDDAPVIAGLLASDEYLAINRFPRML